MAFRGMQPQDATHIVKQELHRYTYGVRKSAFPLLWDIL